jgi:seryl-tRNA synthetase
MSGNIEHNPLLSKVLDQLIQLFDLASKIDAKTNQLETKQEQMASTIKGISSTNAEQSKTLYELKLKVNTIDTVNNEASRRKEQRFNWILSLLLIIVSSICSYLLYLLR